MSQLSLFGIENSLPERIRRATVDGKEYFSCIDLMAEFTESKAAGQYWRDTKKRLADEGFQPQEKILQLKLTAPDGKMRITDCANGQTVLRILQAVPSEKAEPIRQWMAQLGYERLEEAANPELGIKRARERAIAAYQKRGADQRWIDQRIRGIDFRHHFTDALKRHVEGANYAAATDAVYVHILEMTAKQLRAALGLRDSDNIRDRMGWQALLYIELAEGTLTDELKSREWLTWAEAEDLITRICAVIGGQARQLEQHLGRRLATGQRLIGASR